MNNGLPSGLANIGSSKNSGIQVYPNPCSEYFQLQIPAELNTVNIDVYNSVGKLIHEAKNQKLQYQIQLKHESKGLYFIKVTNEEGEQLHIESILKK